MTGGSTSFPPSSSHGKKDKSRWVGRAAILKQYPRCSEWMRLLALTISFLGVQLVWSCQMAQASPYLLSLGLSKSAMAIVFLAGPLSGLIVQPIVGALSDSCRSSLGRRRPFIIGGCVVTSLSVLVFGRTKEVAALFTTSGGSAHSRLTIALAIISIYFIDFSINVVQAVDRSLLVDVVPPHLQADANAWASRLFGIGAVVGYWIGGANLVYWTGGWLGSEQLKVLTLFTSFFLCATHTITVVCVTERVLISKYDDDTTLEGNAATRAMDEIWTTLRTLPRPIQQVFNVQFSSWIGWFPLLFFGTTWIAETYSRTHNGTDLVDAPAAIQELATRAGSQAMLFNSIISLSTSIILPFVIATSSDAPVYRTPASTSFPSTFQTFINRFLPLSWLSLSLLWTISNACFASLLMLTYFATSVGSASTIIALAGFSWAVSNWAPFAILGDLILRIGAAPTDLSSHHQLWDVPASALPDDQQHFIISSQKEDYEKTGYSTPSRRSQKRNTSLSDTETSEAFFDATASATSLRSIDESPSQHPYGDHRQSQPHPHLATLTVSTDLDPDQHLQQFSASSSQIFFHPDSFPSAVSIGNDPYASTIELRTPTTLQLIHSDPFDDVGTDSPPSSRLNERRNTAEWDQNDTEDESGSGRDQAGVILGCHNIYLVIPQLIVTGLSSIIFAILAPSQSVLGSHGGVATAPSSPTTDAVLDSLGVLARQVASEPVKGWDALGLIFRIGGVSVAFSTFICWKMTRDRDRESSRRRETS